MRPAQFDKLSERQRACLRLVLQHMTSKEIGRELGISPRTVDAHFMAALQNLGLTNRVEAARMLAQYEAAEATQSLPRQPQTVAEPPIFPNLDASSNHGNERTETVAGKAVREEQVPFRMDHAFEQHSFPWPLPSPGRKDNDLTIGARLAWIIVLGLLWVLMFGAIPAGYYALSRVL